MTPTICSDAELYPRLASKILEFWNARREDDALRALERAISTAEHDGEKARLTLFIALLEHRIGRSPRAMLRWLEIVLQRFQLNEAELPAAYRAGVSAYVSVHLDRYGNFAEHGTIERVHPDVDPERFDPNWGAVDFRRFGDRDLRGRLAVVNLFNEDGLAILNNQLDGLGGDQVAADLVHGLAMPQSWRQIDPAALPQDERLEHLVDQALDRLIAAAAQLETEPLGMTEQAKNRPGRFTLFVKFIALTWLTDPKRYEAAKAACPPQLFWPALAAASHLRSDIAWLNEVLREVGRTAAAPLLLKGCDPRKAFNFSRDIKIEAPPLKKPLR
ncbi:hypothetical protein [Chitinimonas lacunae]|uniref:Uncharacterized protein n=1 Tax=Chitinimonas lacunae TaxID=1963018 RepID=A0ABV8MR57_9NEIS